VLLRCGDVWRAEILRVTRSGASGSPIAYGSYPIPPVPQPALAGTQPITGWSLSSGSIWTSDLAAGSNAGLFPNGINQLFRDGSRLRLAGGPISTPRRYSTIDAQPPESDHRRAAPGGRLDRRNRPHPRMRWYILNRQVASDSVSTLTLNTSRAVGRKLRRLGLFS